MKPTTTWRGRQLHYQPVASHVHPFLVDLWDAVREETDGRLDIEVIHSNGGSKQSHLEIVDDVISGALEFYVLMGSIMSPLAPSMSVQSLPFAFRNNEDVYNTMDGALGAVLREDLMARGVYLVPGGLMENGFRHISTTGRVIRNAADLDGLRIRVPEGKVFDDTFRELGAEPVPLFVLDLYQALKDGRLEAQENPLAILDSLKLSEVCSNVSVTSHMWSGFNMIGSLKFWHALPEDVQQIVLRNVSKHVGRQRAHTQALNASLADTLRAKGMKFNTTDVQSFRERLAGGFYRRWRAELGERVWTLLEAQVGRLA